MKKIILLALLSILLFGCSSRDYEVIDNQSIRGVVSYKEQRGGVSRRTGTSSPPVYRIYVQTSTSTQSAIVEPDVFDKTQVGDVVVLVVMKVKVKK